MNKGDFVEHHGTIEYYEEILFLGTSVKLALAGGHCSVCSRNEPLAAGRSDLF